MLLGAYQLNLLPDLQFIDLIVIVFILSSPIFFRFMLFIFNFLKILYQFYLYLSILFLYVFKEIFAFIFLYDIISITNITPKRNYVNMIKYYKLLDLLNRKEIGKEELRQRIGISSATIAKLSKHEYVSLEVIDKICNALNCQPGDLMEFIPDSESK